jgi:hypothetical protein
MHANDGCVDHLHCSIMGVSKSSHDVGPDAGEGSDVVYRPNLSGRSCHGVPDRKTQNMPLRTRRSFTRARGTPRGLSGSIDLMADHSSSKSSHRMIWPLRSGGLNNGLAVRLNTHRQRARLGRYVPRKQTDLVLAVSKS